MHLSLKYAIRAMPRVVTARNLAATRSTVNATKVGSAAQIFAHALAVKTVRIIKVLQKIKTTS